MNDNLENTEDYFEFESPMDKRKNLIRSEAMLSGRLLEIESLGIPDESGYFTITPVDLAKGNFNPAQLTTGTLIANAANLTREIGLALNLDLRPAQRFLINELNFDTNVSRAKGGWSGYLSKTSKSISEETLTQKANEISSNQGERGFLGLMKRKL